MKPADRWDTLIEFWCSIYAQDWRLAKAQMEAESAGDPRAISPVGARGLFQFMPATWDEWVALKPGVGCDPSRAPSPHDPDAAVRLRCAYWAWLCKNLPKDTQRAALAAYNWGIGRVWRAGAAHGENWLLAAPDETQRYVERIIARWRALRGEGDTR